MDIDFQIENVRFLVRSSAIITDKSHSKIILFKVPERNLYMLPGGRCKHLENSHDAIKREIKEELGLDKQYDLISVEENFLLDKNTQNIEFVYYTEIDDIDMISPQENNNQEFEIVDIKKINTYNLYPNSLKKIIEQN